MAADFCRIGLGYDCRAGKPLACTGHTQGKTLGIPTLEAPKADFMCSLPAAGKSILKTAEDAGISVGMVHVIKTATEAPQNAYESPLAQPKYG
jgi:hypothetical protein